MAKVSGSRRSQCSVVSVIIYCVQCFVLFALFFSHNHANISIFLSHWHSHINFYSQFSQFMRRCKDCNACRNWWYLCIVLLREITQYKTDRNIANLSVLLLFLENVPGKGAFFFSSVRQLYIRDFIFEIWIENILQKNIIAKKVFLPLWDCGKISIFCNFRKLENFKIFIGYNIKSYNETSQCSNLVQYLRFERNIPKNWIHGTCP